MASSFNRSFKFAVATAAAMALGGLYEAPANAAPPERGSPQWNLMHPFASFITKMHTKAFNGTSTGWCCDWGDGRGDLKEEATTDAGGKTHYRVFVTRDAYGPAYENIIPPEGKWVDVPDALVLSSEDADRECKVERTADPNSTCKTPDFNILWLSQYDGHVYCYWPLPKLGFLEEQYRPATGGETKLARNAPAYAPAP